MAHVPPELTAPPVSSPPNLAIIFLTDHRHALSCWLIQCYWWHPRLDLHPVSCRTISIIAWTNAVPKLSRWSIHKYSRETLLQQMHGWDFLDDRGPHRLPRHLCCGHVLKFSRCNQRCILHFVCSRHLLVSWCCRLHCMPCWNVHGQHGQHQLDRLRWLSCWNVGAQIAS